MLEKQELSAQALVLNRTGLNFANPAQILGIARSTALTQWLGNTLGLVANIKALSAKELSPAIQEVIGEIQETADPLNKLIASLNGRPESPDLLSNVLKISRKLKILAEDLGDKTSLSPEELLSSKLTRIRERCRGEKLESVLEYLVFKVIASDVSSQGNELTRRKFEKFLKMVGPKFEVKRKGPNQLTSKEEQVLKIIREIMTSN